MPTRCHIPQQLWEHHRPELRKLYIEQGMTLDQIKTYMEEHHSFEASKGQYEAAFKNWGFRKNLNFSDWEYVNHQIKKRKAETAVYLNSILIPSKRVRKELGRRFPPSYKPCYPTAPSPQTPSDISVRTPGTPRNLASALTPENPSTFQIPFDNLPWFQFQRLFKFHADVNQDWLTRIFDGGDLRTRRQSASLPASPDTIYSIGSSWPLSPQTNWLEPYISGVLPVSHSDTSRDPTTTPDDEDIIRRVSRTGLPLPWYIVRPVTSTPDFSIGVDQLAALLFYYFVPVSMKIGSIEYLTAVQSRLQALCLETNQGEILSSAQKMLGPFNREALSEFLKFAAFLASNNMLHQEQGDIFLKWIFQCNNQSIFEEFLSIKVPTIDAFASVMFSSALRSRNYNAVRILLEAGVDQNAPISWSGETPLQCAASNGDIELARILLDSGADVHAEGDAVTDAGILTTALQSAVYEGKVEMTKMLLDRGANVNHAHEYGPSALAIALSHNQDVGTLIARILLKAGADVESSAIYNDNRTALQAAVSSGNIGLVRLLLGAGADVNALGGPCEGIGGVQGWGTVLQQVADGENHEQSLERAQMLLDLGADINAQAEFNPDFHEDANEETERIHAKTALQGAADIGSIELVQMLLAAGADVNAPAAWCSEHGYGHGITALQGAARSGNVELVQMLLGARADVNAPGRSALSMAAGAEKNNIELVLILIAAGADINHVHGPPILVTAARTGNPDLMQLLLAAGANMNAIHEPTALETAIEHGHTKLAGTKVNVDYPGLDGGWVANALPVAVASGNMEMVQLLLDAGADPNAYTSKKYSSNSLARNALATAVSEGSVEMIGVLLNAGANVNARTQPSGGSTALQLAADYSTIEPIKILLDAGADINASASQQYGRTALQEAIVKGHTHLVRYFLELGADINAPAAHLGGITALQGVAIEGQLGIAHMLINEQPAEINGRTALEGAAEHGRLDMLQLLVNAGATTDERHTARAKKLAAQRGHVGVVKFLEKF
ncbi:ankyrin repeat-containing domain protein [Trichophaea hybrida]|nr:ankyrin repeat-containing domain protein [Trichophaea hybrida]